MERDDAEALKWFRRAAAQEDAEAQKNLGHFLWHGRGAPVDKKEAIRWWRSAASKGSANAKSNLERYLSDWDRFVIDVEDAYAAWQDWLQRAFIRIIEAILSGPRDNR